MAHFLLPLRRLTLACRSTSESSPQLATSPRVRWECGLLGDRPVRCLDRVTEPTSACARKRWQESSRTSPVQLWSAVILAVPSDAMLRILSVSSDSSFAFDQARQFFSRLCACRFNTRSRRWQEL
jgi:hypothetical protein